MRRGVFAFLVVVLVALATAAQAELVPSEFTRILPGVSTRTDVESKFGRSEVARHEARYSNSNYTVIFQYSRGDCRLSFLNLSLPEWTVESVSFEWIDGKEPKLKDIVLDIRSFRKKQTSDVITHDTYSNVEKGISVVYDRKINGIIGVYLRPSLKVESTHQCRTVE